MREISIKQERSSLWTLKTEVGPIQNELKEFSFGPKMSVDYYMLYTQFCIGVDDVWVVCGPRRSFTPSNLKSGERRKIVVKQSRDEAYKIGLCKKSDVDGEVHQRIFNTRRYDVQQVTHGVKLITVSDAFKVTLSTTDGQVHELKEIEGKVFREKDNMSPTDWIKLLMPGLNQNRKNHRKKAQSFQVF